MRMPSPNLWSNSSPRSERPNRVLCRHCSQARSAFEVLKMHAASNRLRRALSRKIGIQRP